MKYLFEFPRQSACALCEYNDAGYLVKFDLTAGAFEHEHYGFFYSKIPKTLEVVENWKAAKFPNVNIKQVAEDLSFERFYNAYNYKVSSRKKAENVWSRLSDTNKAKAIAYIPKYDRFLSVKGYNKKYPEVYLNSEMWEN